MKRALTATASLILTATFGGYTAAFVNAYILFPSLQSTVRVRWEDERHRCGVPRKILANTDEVVIDNPLCKYSSDLAEIPIVTHRELARNPAAYDGEIVRVKGRFDSNLEDPFRSRLNPMPEDGAEPMHIGAGYWSFDVSEILCNFIDRNAAETNSADVTLIIQFIDASDNPSAVAFNDNSPLLMTILDVEEMKPVLPTPKPQRTVHRHHRNGHCWNSSNRSFSVYH